MPSNITNEHLIKTKLQTFDYQFHNWLGFLSASDSSRYPMGKSCHLCGKQFRDVWFLKQHLRIHTGAKPFACLICGHRANRKSNMTQHIRTVHRDVPEAETVSFLYEATDMPDPTGHPQWYNRAIYYDQSVIETANDIVDQSCQCFDWTMKWVVMGHNIVF